MKDNYLRRKEMKIPKAVTTQSYVSFFNNTTTNRTIVTYISNI